MASTSTGIEWTEATWNPVRGCSRVSPGCVNCYAEKIGARFSGPGKPYEGLARWHTDSEGQRHPRWTGALRFVPEALSDPLSWRKPRRIFVNSMSDLFHEKVSDGQIAAVFATMAACPQHTFQVLTKRADRMAAWFRWMRERVDAANADPATGGGWTETRLLNLWAQQRSAPAGHPVISSVPWPLPNVWLGVSAEDQQRADERIPHLLDCPAAVRWISYEPALGPVDFEPYMPVTGAYLGGPSDLAAEVGRPAISWIVVGGESGGGARPFDVAWARSTIRQCEAAGVACFVKQLGARPVWCSACRGRGFGFGRDFGVFECPECGGDGSTFHEPGTAPDLRLRDPKGGDPGEWPADLRVRQFPGGGPWLT